ncbi:hypothetical protein ANN_07443 [Periplaneta americana]|uniref:Cubilin n=1 Tax=Periplaneta americana TaxID=6978 RepID=A0ABQ8T017_PERAM|nr:hypothetical protein ANN_07443 [Periplaneta americana]
MYPRHKIAQSLWRLQWIIIHHDTRDLSQSDALRSNNYSSSSVFALRCRFNIKEEITWTKFYCTEIVRGYAYLINPVIPNHSYECIFNGPESTGEIITTCSLTIPNGTTYDFQPNSEQTGDEVDRPKFNYTGTEDYCQILMTKCFDFNSLGIYKLEVTYEDNTTESELCVVTAQASAFDFIPTSAVDVLPDQSAFFKFRDPIINIMGCIIQTISETTPDEAFLYPEMSNSSSDLLSYVSYWGKDEPGHCGAEVVYNPLNDTNLRLLYFNETYSMYADLVINGLPTPKPPRRTFFWHIGKTETLIADRDNISFCEMKDPSNVTVLSQATDKSCHYTRYGATVADDGIWRVLYWQKGDILSEVVEFDITVSRAMENSGVWTSVEVSEIYSEGVDLLCSMSSGYARSCLFVRPDGTVIVPHEGLGNERYLYYGKGLGTPDGYGSNAECGLTIRPKLQDEDHGEWKCVMEFVSTDYGTTKSKMAFLSVPKNTSVMGEVVLFPEQFRRFRFRKNTMFQIKFRNNSHQW